MAFEHKYNKDDIHSRSVIAGLVNLLNNKIFFNNTLSDETNDVIQVPFYFSFTGDERYLQDHFLNWGSCQSEIFADGNYDKIPRGIVNLSDKSIDENALTQRFIRGTYTKLVDGKIETFSANLNPIPLVFGFEIQIITDTMTDLSKIEQTILETFYKVQTFNVDFKGFMIACTSSFPDTFTNEKIFEYSYPDTENEFKLTFNVNVDTYYPVVDALGVVPENKKYYIDNIDNLDYYSKGNEAGALYNEANDLQNPNHNRIVKSLTTERHAANRMTHIPIGEENVDLNSPNAYKGIKSITFTKISNEEFGSPGLPDGIGTPPDYEIMKSPIYFGWKYEEFIHKIDILYNFKDDPDTWYYVIKGSRNDLLHTWDFHTEANFFQTIELNIVSDRGSGAELYGVINSSGEIVDVTIVQKGNNYPQDTYVEAEHSLLESSSVDTDDCGDEIEVIKSEAVLSPVIIGGEIVDVTISDSGSGYFPSSTVEIGFKIRSTADKTINDIFSDENGDQIFLSLE